MTTPLTFVSAGFGNAVCANRITAVLQPSAAAARRKLRCAKDEDAYLDLTFGRRLKSLLVLDDGMQVGCGLTTKTILSRIARLDMDLEDVDDIVGDDDDNSDLSDDDPGSPKEET